MWKKVIKKICILLCTAYIMVVAVAVVGYFVNNDTKSYTRVLMHELYEQEEIDSIFIGASHVYRGVNPWIVDEIWGENTFNLSTSSQTIDGSYALLKEANKIGGIKCCYLEVSARMVCYNKETRQSDVTASYIISDYMRLSLNKVLYILNAMEPKNYINAFCPARRNWRKIYSFGFMRDTFQNKSEKGYKEYDYVENETEYYAGKGFVYSRDVVTYTGTEEPIDITENYISDDYLFYFAKIVKYCRENDIELVCFSMPMTQRLIGQLGNYDSYLKQVRDLCERYEVLYYDFNCANQALLDLQDSDFKDANHLNGKGAEKFSRVFADFFAGKIDERELFYSSYAEKKLDSKGIFGCQE
jgi:hypothetical protein